MNQDLALPTDKPLPRAKRHESRGTGDKSDPRCSLWTRIASVEGCSERDQHARVRTLPDPLALAVSGNQESMRSPPQPDWYWKVLVQVGM